MDLTCVASAVPSVLHCTANTTEGWFTQPVATVITGGLAVCAAAIAYVGVSKQASSTLSSATTAADASIKKTEIESRLALERDQVALEEKNATIRRQLSSFVNTALGSTIHIMAVGKPRSAENHLPFLQRIVDRLNDLQTASALGSTELSKALMQSMYFEAAIILYRDMWAADEPTEAMLDDVRIMALSVIRSLELLAEILGVEESKEMLRRFREENADLIARVEAAEVRDA
ncbi:MAG TPA: hypothetical protein VGU66_18830 [Candidatus Elarobacter sp.]|nr:hypothetical protein [Candidatus Elarobacter sp.]